MYTAHFGLSAAPFSITPDPHYLYLSVRHREALAHLLYGVNEGPGFVLLTGEVGTGKTTLCRCLIEQLPDSLDVAFLLNPRVSAIELLAALFDELRISYDHDFSLKNFIDTLYSYLLTAHSVGRRTVLILDEAQNLSQEVLEQVRLLTNLETTSHKLLQIILVGQPELKTLLKQTNLRQLAQRITARYHLLPLPAKDIQAYINHRLAVSGARGPLFNKAAVKEVHRYSGGVPRLINIICDRALLGGYVHNKNPIDATIVRKAVHEVRGDNNYQKKVWFTGALLFTLVLLGGGGTLWWWKNHTPPAAPLYSSEPSAAAESSIASANTLTLPPPSTTGVAAPTPSLLSLLQDAKVPSDTETAFVTLFHLWQVEYTSLTGNTACERAALRGLACLYKTGSWEDLRTFNRPAVIELVTEDRKQHLVVVTGLQKDKVTLAIGEKIYQFSLNEVNQHWLGQFLLLWQPPKLPIPIVKIGITNEAVVWLRKNIDLAEGRQGISMLSATFDNALKKRIIALQQQHGMTADGVAGEQTMVFLQAFSPAGPSLLRTLNVSTP
jgi:general secretion pathway protein A